MKYTIITINYNNQIGLRRTIESVICQTLTDYEYIVIDGGSTDGSIDVIKKYSDYIDFWLSEPDNGIYNAMNKGILRSKAEYTIFMNSGDTFYDKKIVEKINSFIDGTGIVNGDTMLSSGKYVKSPTEVSLGFFLYSTIIHQSTFIKTELLKENNYDERYKLVSDWKFWIQELIFNNVSYKNVSFLVSKFEEGGIGTTNKTLHDNEMLCVLKEMLPIKVLKDYFYFMNGRTWEEKLNLEIRYSRFNKFIYIFNICIIRIMTLFKEKSVWIKQYPLFHGTEIAKCSVLTNLYGNKTIFEKIIQEE